LQHSFYIILLRKRRIDLVVGVSYADDLEKVEDVVLSAIKIWKVIDKDLMVLTILNLTLVPSILIFDFGLNIPENPLQDEKQSYQSD
jgi:small-conductance mechanosensitive channel